MTSTPRLRKEAAQAVDVKGIPEFQARQIENSRSRARLLSYDEIEAWHQDNHFIRHGYRPETKSAQACFASWASLHNETLNIYTHLIPTLCCVIAEAGLFHYMNNRFPEATYGDRLIFAFFLFAATACLGLSVTYHTLMNHSEPVSALWLRADLVGIIILTLGDFVSGIYLVFYCEPNLQKAYWVMILTLGFATAVIVASPRFQGPRWRTFRVVTFVGTGLSGFAPLAHGIQLFGLQQMVKQSGIVYYIGEGFCLLLGAFFYATRIPESLKPGRFDFWGCSHSIFHVLVVLATTVHLVGIFTAFDYNYHHRACSAAFLSV